MSTEASYLWCCDLCGTKDTVRGGMPAGWRKVKIKFDTPRPEERGFDWSPDICGMCLWRTFNNKFKGRSLLEKLLPAWARAAKRELGGEGGSDE